MMLDLHLSHPNVSFSDYALRVFHGNKVHGLVNLLFYFKGSRASNFTPYYISQISFIHGFEKFSGELEILFNTGFISKRMVDALDLSAFVLPFRVGKEEDFIEGNFAGAKVNDSAVFALPDGMKLCFDPEILDFNDSPSKVLLASIGRNMLWNDRETFTQWLSSQRLVFNIDGLLPWGNLATK